MYHKCRTKTEEPVLNSSIYILIWLQSAYSGRGDRADSSTWPEVEGPLSVILFEGWMLGFKPLPADVVKAVDPQVISTPVKPLSSNTQPM